MEGNGVSTKKYSVFESVWIATALLSMEVYDRNDVKSIGYYCFKQSDIVKKAQTLTSDTVDAARVSWWCCADAKKHIYNYLRAGDGNTRRLTAPNEFSEKTIPENLDPNDILEMNGRNIYMEELLFFVNEQYSTIIKSEVSFPFETNGKTTNIDYLWILQYLEENREVPYKDPKKPGLTQNEIESFLAVKANGQKVVAELKKIHALCSEKFNLEKCEKVSWDDGTHTKTKRYLWVPMKYMEYATRQESISVFVEPIDENTARFRMSLELRNDKADSEDMKNYHRHLELPLDTDAELIYVEGSNEFGCPKKIDDDQNVIIEKINNKEYSKVQICRYIDKAEFKTNEEIEAEILNAVTALIPYYDYVLGIENELKEALESMMMENKEKTMIDYAKNMILYGPPGTGKTYATAVYAVSIIENKEIEAVKAEPYDEVFERYNKYKKDGLVAFTTFHQSYGYEEFIEGIKPIIDDTTEEIGYRIEAGAFKKFCKMADLSGGENNYVFIIDEINRGNISKIFGELITLIEDTKRAGMDEETTVILPYSGESFSVPSNVYILGTMNTADRSIALMDTALRRRFEFVEMMPDADVLRAIGADKVDDLDVAKMVEVINERITFLYDREHTIGHAFFTKLAKKPTVDTLKSIFEKSVIPLLQEYFYEDYQKIQLVLGDNGKKDNKYKFILDSDVKVKDIFKGNVDEVIDLPEKKYTINSDAFGYLESYKEII